MTKKEISIGNEAEVKKEKEERKCMVESSVRSDRSVRSVRSDRSVRSKEVLTDITLLTYNSDYAILFSEDLIDMILLHFLRTKNTPITFNKLAEDLDKKKESINVTINRKKEFFNNNSVRGREGLLEVSNIGIKEINSRIDEYNRITKENKEKEEEELHKKSRYEELIIEAKNFLDFYKKEIGDSIRKRVNIILIDFADLAGFSLSLSDQVMIDPEETLKMFELAIEESGLVNNPRIRIKNLPEDHRIFIENLRSKHINELIFVEGRVVSITDVRPQVVNAKFECPSCGTIIGVLQIAKKFREPSRCSCGRRGGFKLISKEMIDTARVILEDLQEKTDNPHTRRLNIFIKEDLTNQDNIKIFTPGNEVKIVGILKEVPVPLRTGGLSTRFEIAIEVNSAELSEEEVNINKLSDEEIMEIQNVAAIIDENGLGEINSSFAPEVYGYEEIKNAIILQLCNQKNIPKSEEVRNKPNILIIGDPGVGKSVLGNFAVSITHGSKRVVGGGSSAVGITASVIKEEEGWRVEPGAFVLARDLLFIDELNNLQDEDKPKLQEAMSEMSVTISKANIRMKMKVTAGALATANPIKGIFKDNEDLVKQFNLPPPIINRFDEIFVMKDNVNENSDEEIASKMISRERGKIKSKYSKKFLRKFFTYIKHFKEPEIDNEIAIRLKKLYSQLRKYKTDSININPRVNEAILMLIKASAKIRLSDKVEEKDIEIAINILSESYFNLPNYSTFAK